MADPNTEPVVLVAKEPGTANTPTVAPTSTSATATETGMASKPQEAQHEVQADRDGGDPSASRKGSRTPPKAINIDKTKPQDFDGELATTNELPSPETLSKIDQYIVLDRDGKTHTFQSLYSGPNVARRVLVVFVRHFFCGVSRRPLVFRSDPLTTACCRTAKSTCGRCPSQ